MGDTEISWTHKPGTRGRTWNPVQGCRRVSPGCEHCYAERLAARFAKDGWSQGLINLKTKRWNGNARLAKHKLAEPLSWREPSTVFVNSMSDLFYEGFSFEEIAAVFGVMAACPQHTFQVLTKRAKRMREWFEWLDEQIEESAVDMSGADCAFSIHMTRDWARLDFVLEYARAALADDKIIAKHDRNGADEVLTWPLSNVWLGVSVENQEAADERIPELLRTPAAVRFLSCEPLIGPVTLHEDGLDWLTSDHCRGIDWVIAGCESGRGARPCSVEWLRSLRDQCASAGVAFFLKQAMSEREICEECGVQVKYNAHGSGDGSASCGCTFEGPEMCSSNGIMRGLGAHEKAGGVIELPYLDGVQHAAFPEVL